MRIGAPSDGLVGRLGETARAIQDRFQKEMKALTSMSDTKVMLGDATVTDQMTFDPALAERYFARIGSGLEGWSVRGVSSSGGEGLRRAFSRFEAIEGRYQLAAHIAVQFHVLLYYRPAQRVIECQKELSEAISAAGDGQETAGRGDIMVLEKLKEMGYGNLDTQGLFEIFYGDDELRERIYSEIHGGQDSDLKQLAEKKRRLFDELDSLLIETYQTTPVLIDDARLATGEEGCVCTFDLDLARDGAGRGSFDPEKIPDAVGESLMGRMAGFEDVLRSLAGAPDLRHGQEADPGIKGK